MKIIELEQRLGGDTEAAAETAAAAIAAQKQAIENAN